MSHLKSTEEDICPTCCGMGKLQVFNGEDDFDWEICPNCNQINQ